MNKLTYRLPLFAVLVFVLALAVMPAAAQGGQLAEPVLTCPAGTEAIGGPYMNIIAQERYARNRADVEWYIVETLNVPEEAVVTLQVWSAVGHPEKGYCEVGPDNDPGEYPCDQDQRNEEFYLWLNATQIAFIADHGTDQWADGGTLNLGTLSAGAYNLTFVHSNETGVPNVNAESVVYKALACAEVDQPGVWNKSSLAFRGTATVSNGYVSAELCNGGDGDMTGTVPWELYYAVRGNPKNGMVIASGNVAPMASGECTILSAPTDGLVGNFKFKAYQEIGHPGKGELWSN